MIMDERQDSDNIVVDVKKGKVLSDKYIIFDSNIFSVIKHENSLEDIYYE